MSLKKKASMAMALTLSLALALAGCGGGGSNEGADDKGLMEVEVFSMSATAQGEQQVGLPRYSRTSSI